MRIPRKLSDAAIVTSAIALTALLPTASASEVRPLSPRGQGQIAVVSTRCPTFSWSEVDEATGYELEMASVNRIETLRVELPGGALSWTPAGADCLEPGARAWWRIRARFLAGAGAWSTPSELSVKPSSSRLSTARRLLARLAENRLTEDQRAELAHLAWSAQPAPSQAPVHDSPGHGKGSQSPREGFGGGLPETQAVFIPRAAGLRVEGADNIAVGARGTGVSVWGQSATADGRGIRGEVDHGETNFTTVAIEGDNSVDLGVLGQQTNDPGDTASGPVGLAGESQDGTGVHGYAEASSGSTTGVYGQSSSLSGRGVCAFAHGSTNPIGVYGWARSFGGFDFYAGGNGSYGTFTGGHEVRLLPGAADPMPGMVVSLTGRVEKRIAPDGRIDLSSTLPTVALTTTENDRAVFGVLTGEINLPLGHWLEDQGGRFAAVNALGEGRVWVTDRNGPIVAGDLLTTSSVPGYAQRQDDRLQRPHTLGKAIETVDWEEVTTTIHHNGEDHRAALIAVVYASG